MSIEIDLINELKLAMPEIADKIYYATAVASPEDVAPPMPLIIVTRITSDWTGQTFCGQDLSMANATLQIDTYNNGAASARALGDSVRQTIANMKSRPKLQSESDFYEPTTRAWRVSATWAVSDLQPTLI